MAIEQTQMLDAGAGGDADVVTGCVRLQPAAPRRSACRFRKSHCGCRRNSTARSPQARSVTGACDTSSQPSAPTSGMAVANRERGGGEIAQILRQLVTPGEQKIVARAVCFREWDLHLFAKRDL